MDWLALKIALEFESGGDSKDCDFWPGAEEDSQEAPECPSWRIYTDANNHPATDAADSPPFGMNALKIRRRLGQLTKWIGKPSKPSIALAGSISMVMDTLFGNGREKPDFKWHLRVQADGGGNRNQGPHVQDQIITFEVKNSAGKWKADATALEAAISLWMFHITELETCNKAQDSESRKNADTDWLQDLEPRRQVRRVLGPNSNTFREYIRRWLDDGVVEELGITNLNPAHQFSGPIGFVRLERQGNHSSKSPIACLYMNTLLRGARSDPPPSQARPVAIAHTTPETNCPTPVP